MEMEGKILAYVNPDALYILDRLEIIEMAAGFLRAILGETDDGNDFTDLLDITEVNYHAEILGTLTEVILILRGRFYFIKKNRDSKNAHK
ncbi:MAG TPA: hypothetical protein VJ583_03530 [Nitrososphaeraceae archaeon]|nr:hypothetical protein [Nitrososphaeraceae archaeon]